MPPCLLTMPTYGGTLAAVRALGRAGVEVTVAGSELLAPARWSRHAHRFVRCPAPREGPRFLEWLLRFGEREPGHFLYPTSDDTAWFFATHQRALSRHFLLFQPSVATEVALLDKRRLHEGCAEVGVPTLPTWFPRSVDEVEQLAPSLPLPVVIKPRTQVWLSTLSHGTVVEARRDLVPAYRHCLEHDLYLPGIGQDFGEVAAPMVQAYRAEVEGGVYSLAGFVDRTGALLGIRAAYKVLQRPRGVGVGLLFEEAGVDPQVVDGLLRLCRRAGYFGVFEVEFVRWDERHHLIDFNPRYYGQMQFEISRGLLLPLLAYHAAIGDDPGVAALADGASAARPPGATYAFAFGLGVVIALRRLLRRPVDLAGGDRSGMDGEGRVDASADPDDPLPGWVHAMSDLYAASRHPRAFYRANLR